MKKPLKEWSDAGSDKTISIFWRNANMKNYDFLKWIYWTIFFSFSNGLSFQFCKNMKPALRILLFGWKTYDVVMNIEPWERNYRSSHSQIFFKIGVLKNVAHFTVKYLCWSLLLINLQAWRHITLSRKDSNTNVFLWNLRIF